VKLNSSIRMDAPRERARAALSLPAPERASSLPMWGTATAGLAFAVGAYLLFA
jgi:hypothetical protein